MALISAKDRNSASAAAAALATSVGLLFTAPRSWPLWLTALVALIPWMPLFVLGAAWARSRHPWLTLFYVLVVSQGGHLLEHVAQMVQMHVLGLTGPNARGVFGALDIEWVHFLWNTWVLVAVVLLLRPFSSNPWLRVTALLAGWHEIEHSVVLAVYLTTGVVGTPGLLGQGGLVGGGLPISRPDLHFAYNLLETVPLFLAFISQVRPTARTGEMPKIASPIAAR